MRASYLEKEYKRLLKQDQAFRKRGKKKQASAISSLEEKVPEKLRQTLRHAFEKAFVWIAVKGEKPLLSLCQREKKKAVFQELEAEAKRKRTKKALRSIYRNAGKNGRKHTLFAAAEGMTLGIAGIGLPDIPLFCALLTKSIYEIAMQYGYECTKDEERWFLFTVLEGALSKKGACELQMKSGVSREEVKKAAERCGRLLADQLLYQKFLQGIFVVGVLGGALSAFSLKQIQKYAVRAYYGRYLQEKLAEKESSVA